MPGMRELKKHLRSINTTSQLAGAMKTVSSAKYSRANKTYAGYLLYSRSCEEIISRFGSALSAVLPCTDPDAPECLVVITSNRGLCGGYNSSLLAFAEECISKIRQRGREYKIVTCGKMASAYFAEHGIGVEREFNLPDVPTYDSCAEIYDYLRSQFLLGSFSSVSFVYQHFKNMLTQIPSKKQLLPLSDDITGGGTTDDSGDGILYIPDKETVMKNACLTCVDSSIYSTILESATGAQAATLMAMREASDNAKESIAALELEISRKRQSEVTSSVIETYSPEEEQNN